MRISKWPACVVMVLTGLWGPAGQAEPRPPATSPGKAPARPAPAEQSGEVDLRPKFEVGRSVRYLMIQDSTTRAAGGAGAKGGGAGAVDAKQRQEIGLSLTVRSADADGGATVDLKLDSIKVVVDAGGERMAFDSTRPQPAAADDPAAAALAGMLGKLVGTTLTAEVDSRGNVTKVTGGDALTGDGLFGRYLADQGARSFFGPLSAAKGFKGKARVGESWTFDDTVGTALMDLRMKTTHRLVSHRAGQAELTVTGVAEPAPESKLGGLVVRRSVYEGSYRWDTRAGRLERMKITQRQEVEKTDEGDKLALVTEATTTIERQPTGETDSPARPRR
ncbi:MAG: hypothetical protein IBJ11_11125 [Phycisphaerales bacterium]|nr:hypothetical protein [Phycisphaerales bacterium]